jgi:hypothetical protein
MDTDWLASAGAADADDADTGALGDPMPVPHVSFRIPDSHSLARPYDLVR